MKTLKLLLVLCFLANCCFGQKITPEVISKLPPEKQEEVNLLMKQGNTAKYVSIGMSAGGGLISIIGLALAISAENNDNYYDQNQSEVGGILFVVGSGIALTSLVPTIIKRTKYNKAKAIISAQPGVSMVPGKVLPNTQSYGLKITIPLGR